MCETRKLVMAILHWKQGLLCDKMGFRIENCIVHNIDLTALSYTGSLEFLLNSIPHNKILDLSKLKAIADNKKKY